jgi:hypothetical protein
MHVRVTYLRAMHDMVRHVRSKFTQLMQTMFPLLHYRIYLVAQKFQGYIIIRAFCFVWSIRLYYYIC